LLGLVVTDVSPGAIVANLETQTSYSNPTIAKSFPSTLLSLTFLNKRKGHRHNGGGRFYGVFFTLRLAAVFTYCDEGLIPEGAKACWILYSSIFQILDKGIH